MLCLQRVPLFVSLGKACFRLLAARFETTLSDVHEETDVEPQGEREIASSKHVSNSSSLQQLVSKLPLILSSCGKNAETPGNPLKASFASL